MDRCDGDHSLQRCYLIDEEGWTSPPTVKSPPGIAVMCGLSYGDLSGKMPSIHYFGLELNQTVPLNERSASAPRLMQPHNRQGQLSVISHNPFRRGFGSRARLLVEGFPRPHARRDLDSEEPRTLSANLVPRLLFLRALCGRSL